MNLLSLAGISIPTGVYRYWMLAESRVRPLQPPPERVSVIMPALNEEASIGKALVSLQEQSLYQSYPDDIEIIVVDNGSEDGTAAVARSLGVTVLEQSQRGVLQARALGIARSAGGIIVSVNADTYYPPQWLQNVVWHFNEPDVVAVAAVPLFDGQPLWNLWVRVLRRAEAKMYGQASAFRRWAYIATGGFNLGVNPTEARLVEREEQNLFKQRLTSVGIFEFEATPVYTSPRRHLCASCTDPTCPNYDYCQAVQQSRRFAHRG